MIFLFIDVFFNYQQLKIKENICMLKYLYTNEYTITI